ncbi:hypothetical protein SmphiM12_495 [Sinorhizobium phage phiM12]|uniref:Uncharacterized protein n=1 Tax=Sinorhizobium phage phiM12 TaxID=1357423 RepID=S5MW20_9CAUD|nr:hypothetical protein AB690_gp132 [Sinorhizobium phage phiM12]AGR48127.1 hypothetical protein SmphiM12_495 [Sinorhizobium phage phiM12]
MTDEVKIQVWINTGEMLVNTYALDPDHPKHPYNQILAEGKRPEDYGIHHPYEEEFGDKSRAELIEEIVRLRIELEGWAKGDAMGVIGKRYK